MTERAANELYWTAIGYAIVGGAAVVTLAGLWLFAPALHRRWLPIARLRPSCWTGRDVLLAFCTLGFPFVIVATLYQIGFFTPLIGPAPDLEKAPAAARVYGIRCAAIASPLSLCVTLGILFMMLFARAGVRPHHLGLSWARWPTNAALALLAVIGAAPLVLALHALITLTLGEGPHPFTLAAGDIKYEWEWFFLGFQLIVAAPLVEEVVFRGVLLGWLRRATLAGHLGIISATVVITAGGAWYAEPGSQEPSFHPEPLLLTAILIGGYVLAMVRLARRYRLQEDEIQAWQPQPSREPIHSEGYQRQEAVLGGWRDANAGLALYGSSMLFAIFHIEAWPAPIALFPFALVLGSLAQRMQSLVGPILLHAAFNLISFIALYALTP